MARTAIASLVVSTFLTVPLTATAEDKKPPTNPVGAGWDSKVKQDAGTTAGRTLSPAQMQSIQAVNKYFNNISNMAGLFAQTNPDGKLQRGKFYIKRPGRFRFDYNRPSRQIIVSDGTYLAVQDLDLNNEDVFTLENTPFRILLGKNVDLLRDARIMQVQQGNDQIAVTLTDKSPDSPGQITVYLTSKADPQLAGWVTTDVQGGVTKVQVSNLSRPANLNANLFVRKKLFLKSIQ